MKKGFLVLAVERGYLTPMQAGGIVLERGEDVDDCLVRLGFLTSEQVEEIRAETETWTHMPEEHFQRPLRGQDLLKILGEGLSCGEESTDSIQVVEKSFLDSFAGTRADFLCRLARAIGAEVCLETGVDRALRTLFDLFGQIRCAALYLRDHPQDDSWLARPRFHAVERGLMAPGALPADIARRILESREIVQFRTLGDDAGSLIAGPLATDGSTDTTVLGILLLEEFDLNAPASFSPGEIEMFAAATHLLAGFVQRCALFEEAYLLRMAAQVQEQFLPRELPAVPGFRIRVHYEPSLAIGGDFYDVRPGQDGGWLAILGDVAGHGPPAALVMAPLLSMFREFHVQGATAVLAAMERVFLHSLQPGNFATALLIEGGPGARLEVRSCGHPAPFVRRAGIWREALLPGAGLPLGLGLHQTQHPAPDPIDLAPGDALLVYSDGLSEARPSSGGAMFGTPGIARILAGAPEGPDAIVDHLREAVYDHAGRSLGDDLTILVVERKG